MPTKAKPTKTKTKRSKRSRTKPKLPAYGTFAWRIMMLEKIRDESRALHEAIQDTWLSLERKMEESIAEDRRRLHAFISDMHQIRSGMPIIQPQGDGPENHEAVLEQTRTP